MEPLRGHTVVEKNMRYSRLKEKYINIFTEPLRVHGGVKKYEMGVKIHILMFLRSLAKLLHSQETLRSLTTFVFFASEQKVSRVNTNILKANTKCLRKRKTFVRERNLFFDK